MRRESAWGWGFVVACAVTGLSRGQTTTRASVDWLGLQGSSDSYRPAISADGRRVAFESITPTFVLGDTNGWRDIFVRDRETGATVRASVHTSGLQANGHCSNAAISADGRMVAFESIASSLVTGDTNGFRDVFVRDLQAGVTVRVSVDSAAVEGDGNSSFPSISASGRFVAFESLAGLVPGDTPGTVDIFVHDRDPDANGVFDEGNGTTVRASVDSAGVAANGLVFDPSISADGRFVAFASQATNLVAGDTNGVGDVFVHDTLTGATIRASVDSAGNEGNGHSTYVSLSADGSTVAFESMATNLAGSDANGASDIFVRRLVAGETACVSADIHGIQGEGTSRAPSLSADGRRVAFYSFADSLVPGDTNGWRDVFVHDLDAKTTTRASVDDEGVQENGAAFAPVLSGDGYLVAFESQASNLVDNDTNAAVDVFVRDWEQPPVVAGCFGDATQAACPCHNFGLAGHGCANSATSGGAVLSERGTRRLSEDTWILTASGELPSPLSGFFQCTTLVAPFQEGDGLLCLGGNMKRLYLVTGADGVVSAPSGGAPSISAQSAIAGDPIAPGSTRHYQVIYRDPAVGFCASQPGGPVGSIADLRNVFNSTNTLSATWSP